VQCSGQPQRRARAGCRWGVAVPLIPIEDSRNPGYGEQPELQRLSEHGTVSRAVQGGYGPKRHHGTTSSTIAASTANVSRSVIRAGWPVVLRPQWGHLDADALTDFLHFAHRTSVPSNPPTSVAMGAAGSVAWSPAVRHLAKDSNVLHVPPLALQTPFTEGENAADDKQPHDQQCGEAGEREHRVSEDIHVGRATPGRGNGATGDLSGPSPLGGKAAQNEVRDIVISIPRSGQGFNGVPTPPADS